MVSSAFTPFAPDDELKHEITKGQQRCAPARRLRDLCVLVLAWARFLADGDAQWPFAHAEADHYVIRARGDAGKHTHGDIQFERLVTVRCADGGRREGVG